MTIDQQRTDFEQNHPVPIGIFWNDIDQKYAATGEPFWHVTLDVYNAFWQGYQSGRAAVQGEAVATLRISWQQHDGGFYEYGMELDCIHNAENLKDYNALCQKLGPGEHKLFTSPQPAPDQWNAAIEAAADAIESIGWYAPTDTNKVKKLLTPDQAKATILALRKGE